MSVYCNSIYKVFFCYFTLIFDLELIPFQKKEKCGNKTPFRTKSTARGGLIPAYHCRSKNKDYLVQALGFSSLFTFFVKNLRFRNQICFWHVVLCTTKYRAIINLILLCSTNVLRNRIFTFWKWSDLSRSQDNWLETHISCFCVFTIFAVSQNRCNYKACYPFRVISVVTFFHAG